MMPESGGGQGVPRLRVGPRGWRHPAWQGSFYPDDLPEDWRLSFLATAAQAVLVPEPDWVAAGAAGCAAWAAEVPDAFRFYFEVGGAALDAAAPCAAALGDRLGGLLLPTAPNPAALAAAPEAILARLVLPAATAPGSGWRAWADAEALPGLGRVAVLLLRQDGLDLRALRARLEAFAQCRDPAADQAILVCDPVPSTARLRELRAVAELLGLA